MIFFLLIFFGRGQGDRCGVLGGLVWYANNRRMSHRTKSYSLNQSLYNCCCCCCCCYLGQADRNHARDRNGVRNTSPRGGQGKLSFSRFV